MGAAGRVLRHVVDRSAAAGIISRPLPGGLPLRRWVPQGAHSLVDLLAGLAVALAGRRAEEPRARGVGLALGLGLAGTTLLTDSRVSLSGLIPIELHELADHGWGLAAMAAPFVGGYARRAPGAAAVHVLAGAAVLLGALLTDYRCRSGMHLGKERMTDPGPISA
ncbi:MAG: hypothetical protein JXB05_11395 [Myxococcaceae bacterium]|nr:hypothetical protein [Myxococcaceae bacterium]